MSRSTLIVKDTHKNVFSVNKFNREKVKAYQVKMQIQKRRSNAPVEDRVYEIVIKGDWDQIMSLVNYCKIKNIYSYEVRF